MDLYTFAKFLHIGAGTTALIGFWSAGMARKGGALHVRVGQIYLAAMSVVMVTGLIMASLLLAR